MNRVISGGQFCNAMMRYSRQRKSSCIDKLISGQYCDGNTPWLPATATTVDHTTTAWRAWFSSVSFLDTACLLAHHGYDWASWYTRSPAGGWDQPLLDNGWNFIPSGNVLQDYSESGSHLFSMSMAPSFEKVEQLSPVDYLTFASYCWWVRVMWSWHAACNHSAFLAFAQ